MLTDQQRILIKYLYSTSNWKIDS